MSKPVPFASWYLVQHDAIRFACIAPAPVFFQYKDRKAKVVYSCYWNSISQLRSVTCHVITQYYLPPDTSEHILP